MGNVERDRKHYEELQSLGWNVLIVWECELKKKVIDTTMIRIEDQLRDQKKGSHI